MRNGEASVSVIAEVQDAERTKALTASTVAFTPCFAVWTIFSFVGIGIKQQLGLDETEFGLLVGTPILTGSLIRLALGVWTDRYGGRAIFITVMLAAAVATLLLSYATTYPTMLLAVLGVGVAGGACAWPWASLGKAGVSSRPSCWLYVPIIRHAVATADRSSPLLQQITATAAPLIWIKVGPAPACDEFCICRTP